jgi:hypothetical protein
MPRHPAPLLACIVPHAAGAAAAPVTGNPVLTTTQTAAGQPIPLPDGTAQVTVSEFEIAPGARLPVHKHPFPRMAYVLAGHLVLTHEETTRVAREMTDTAAEKRHAKTAELKQARLDKQAVTDAEAQVEAEAKAAAKPKPRKSRAAKA